VINMEMKYEIVQLNEKLVVGLCARTNNQAPDMGQVIGGLWTRFYGEGVYGAIQNKVSGKSIGLYSDYAGDYTADYDITVGCEVAEAEPMPQGCTLKRIPAGPYAKFVLRGELHQAVGEFWEKLWNMDLKRTYQADFEEYQNADPEHAEIHVYISLAE